MFKNYIFCAATVGVVLSLFIRINCEENFNVVVNELFKQCRVELSANGTFEDKATNLSSRAYSNFSQLRVGGYNEEKITNYVTPRPVLPVTGDLVRAQTESMARIMPASEMEQYYCVYTRMGLLTKNGDLIKDQAKCSPECQSLVYDCVTNEEVDDRKSLYEKSYKNVMCVYVTNWLLYGFAP